MVGAANPSQVKSEYSERGMTVSIPMERGDIPGATCAVIDLAAIAETVSRIRKRIGPKKESMAIVKADA